MTLRRFFPLAALLALTAATGARAQEEVTAPGPLGDLAGTWIAPGEGRPVILILPGSGPTDRDGNNPLGVTAGSYRMLGEDLARQGIGTLRIDKRGMFGSKAAVADPNAVTLADYATDAAAWVALARDRTGRDCIWLLGHSEGGLLALYAAAQIDHLCGLVLVAAPGRPLGDVLRQQLESNPANGPVLGQALAAIARLEAGERVDVAGMHPGLVGLFAPQVQGYLIDMMGQDPAGLARASDLPLLIVQGGKDIQVPQVDGETLHAARPDAGYLLLPDMNHVLKQIEGDGPAANIASYSDPDQPLAPGLVEAIAAFVLAPEGET